MLFIDYVLLHGVVVIRIEETQTLFLSESILSFPVIFLHPRLPEKSLAFLERPTIDKSCIQLGSTVFGATIHAHLIRHEVKSPTKKEDNCIFLPSPMSQTKMPPLDLQ